MLNWQFWLFHKISFFSEFQSESISYNAESSLQMFYWNRHFTLKNAIPLFLQRNIYIFFSQFALQFVLCLLWFTISAEPHDLLSVLRVKFSILSHYFFTCFALFFFFFPTIFTHPRAIFCLIFFFSSAFALKLRDRLWAVHQRNILLLSLIIANVTAH